MGTDSIVVEIGLCFQVSKDWWIKIPEAVNPTNTTNIQNTLLKLLELDIWFRPLIDEVFRKSLIFSILNACYPIWNWGSFGQLFYHYHAITANIFMPILMLSIGDVFIEYSFKILVMYLQHIHWLMTMINNWIAIYE